MPRRFIKFAVWGADQRRSRTHRRVGTKTDTFKRQSIFTTFQELIRGGQMYPSRTRNLPFSQGSYVPYFYESGRFLVYGQPSLMAPTQAVSGPYARHDFASDPALWPRHEQFQTVEQIVARGYLTVPQSEPETAILSDKQQTSWLGLDDVVHQIRRRHTIYQQNLYEIDLAVCEANNAVHRQEADQAHPANERQRYSAGKRIQDLYEQQRGERVNLWKDVSRLRLALPEAAQLYLAAYRKMSLLEDDPGDGP